ncbi:putative short chain dehydrogenase [Aspergillus clavatus NRRL 1]|uniref:Short chain dehydrogenase, putative n=1 Tax=Aspergillus clavatus (strain ATCC 1007 / CBS 513.65 / DSM 816 / NCTC 3887 / NRRL 1 / QM 1276 / 107) TaxID=344612 RepID=A1C5J2_ASPCL|nr:short chain dehydrogenase, putative [Aspergillus clavatus NRRL 1]EAW14960.1 short chain dehydrogenase, putative [Aspergillus clavatus NRRL 1]
MASKIVLITGANTGIGFQIVRALCSSNQAYSIIVGGRSTLKVQHAIRAIESEFPSTASQLFPLEIDIEHDDQIQRAFSEVQAKFGRLDALVNNAGASFDLDPTTGTMTERDMWNKTWNVNVVGTHMLTSTFVPLLLQSTDPRVLFISSGTSSLTGTDNRALAINQFPAKGWPKAPGFSFPAYRSSKCGLNMVMREWDRILKEDGVKVWGIAPGFLATGLAGVGEEELKKRGAGDPAVAGPFIRAVLEGEWDTDVGRVVSRNGVQPW